MAELLIGLPLAIWFYMAVSSTYTGPQKQIADDLRYCSYHTGSDTQHITCGQVAKN